MAIQVPGVLGYRGQHESEVIAITPLAIAVLVLLSLLGVLLLGGVIVVAVETSRHGARKILEGRQEQREALPERPGADRAAVEGAEGSFSAGLGRQVRTIRELLEHADAVGTPTGELRQQLDELERHSAQVDAQLDTFDRARAEAEPELLEQLRRRAGVIAETLARIRDYLAQEEASRSNVELADTVGRVQIETDALNSIRGEDPLVEIERLHRLATEGQDRDRE